MNVLRRFFNRVRLRKTIKRDESHNVVNSIVKARMLYRELATMAHPDRHPQKTEIAEDLMKRINDNRYNYSALIALKQEVTKTLY